MSGHGNWSGQAKRDKRDDTSGEDGNNASSGELYDLYASGGYGAEYDELGVDEMNVKLIQERGIGLLMNSYGEDSQREMAKVADAIARDFPILQRASGNISSEDDPSMDSAIAWAECGNPLAGAAAKVVFHDRFSGLSPDAASRQWSTPRGGFHFPNNGIGAVTAHELGHNIEALIINARHGRGWQAHQDWTNGSTGRRIVERAIDAVYSVAGATTSRSTQSLAETFGGRISGYAKTNIHETIAEAFGDCFANGRNASPLSIAIYDEARRYARTFAS